MNGSCINNEKEWKNRSRLDRPANSVFFSKEGTQGGPECCQHLWTPKADFQSCFSGLQGMSQDLNFSFLTWKKTFLNWDYDSPWVSMNYEHISPRWWWTEGLPHTTFSQTWNTSMKSRAMLNFWQLVASTKANEIVRKPSSVLPVGILSIRGEDEVCLSVNP